jgi:hypothetical protein
MRAVEYDNTVSRVQCSLARIFDEIWVRHEVERRTDDGYFSMDIYLPDYDVAVEFDGPTHYYHTSETSSTSRDASTTTQTAKTELRDFFLARQCAKVVTVPRFEFDAEAEALRQTEAGEGGGREGVKFCFFHVRRVQTHTFMKPVFSDQSFCSKIFSLVKQSHISASKHMRWTCHTRRAIEALTMGKEGESPADRTAVTRYTAAAIPTQFVRYTLDPRFKPSMASTSPPSCQVALSYTRTTRPS